MIDNVSSNRARPLCARDASGKKSEEVAFRCGSEQPPSRRQLCVQYICLRIGMSHDDSKSEIRGIY